jgi:hypothetical protein
MVNQSSLNISNVQLVFVGERLTNSPGVVRFDRPLQPIPFGKTKFEDLTYLPGSVVFNFFGHEVELLPRTMYVNRKERAWSNGPIHLLTPAEKLPESALVERGKKRKRRP